MVVLLRRAVRPTMCTGARWREGVVKEGCKRTSLDQFRPLLNTNQISPVYDKLGPVFFAMFFSRMLSPSLAGALALPATTTPRRCPWCWLPYRALAGKLCGRIAATAPALTTAELPSISSLRDLAGGTM